MRRSPVSNTDVSLSGLVPWKAICHLSNIFKARARGGTLSVWNNDYRTNANSLSRLYHYYSWANYIHTCTRIELQMYVLDGKLCPSSRKGIILWWFSSFIHRLIFAWLHAIITEATMKLCIQIFICNEQLCSMTHVTATQFLRMFHII